MIITTTLVAPEQLQHLGAKLIAIQHIEALNLGTVKFDRLLVSDELNVMAAACAGEETYRFDGRSLLLEREPSSGQLAVTTTAFTLFALVQLSLWRRLRPRRFLIGTAMHQFMRHDDGSFTLIESNDQTTMRLGAFFTKLRVRSPHYRCLLELAAAPTAEPLSILGALPVTDKLAYRTVLAREALSDLGSESFVTDFSSGSASRPVLRFCRTVDDLCEQEATEGVFRRIELGPDDRLVFVDAGAAQIYDFYARAARNLGVSDVTFLHLTQDVGAALMSLSKLQPSVIVSIPTLMAQMRGALQEADILERPPRCLVSMGEAIPAILRAAVKRAWHCRVMSFYGTTETGGFASECECEDGHHFDPSENVVTIAHARELDAMTLEGELLVTTIQLRTHAVVKYAVGDIVRVSIAPCACGEPTPRLWHVRRAQDEFVFAGEKFAYDMICGTLSKAAPGIHSVTLEVEDISDGPEQVLLRTLVPDEFRPLGTLLMRALREEDL